MWTCKNKQGTLSQGHLSKAVKTFRALSLAFLKPIIFLKYIKNLKKSHKKLHGADDTSIIFLIFAKRQ
jgi:hypothetical protein